MKKLSINRHLKLENLAFYKYILFLLAFSASLWTYAIEPPTAAQESRPDSEYALNFGAVYVAQWGFYLVSQQETIEKHGSFENWKSYPTQPEFDKDSFDYNIFKHSFAGNYYYHFYRYRGYSELESFAWTFISSLAFEFTIETYTEKPSIQDIYQTPIYGTVLGMGTERLSRFLLTQDSYLAKTFGYILNPFELFKNSSSDLSLMPTGSSENPGLLLSWRY